MSCHLSAKHHRHLCGFYWACRFVVTRRTDSAFHVQDPHRHSRRRFHVPYSERKSVCWTSESSRCYHLWWMFNGSPALLWSTGPHPSGCSQLPKTLWRTDNSVWRGLSTDSSCYSWWFSSRHHWGILMKIVPVESDGSAAIMSQHVFATCTWSSSVFPVVVGHWTWPYCGWCREHRNSWKHDHLQWRWAHQQNI